VENYLLSYYALQEKSCRFFHRMLVFGAKLTVFVTKRGEIGHTKIALTAKVAN
jgi:hypothetical protein